MEAQGFQNVKLVDKTAVIAGTSPSKSEVGEV